MAKKKKPKIEIDMDCATAAILEIMQENMAEWLKRADDRVTWYFVCLFNVIILLVNVLIVIFFYHN